MGRSLLENIDVVASSVHMKVAYHDRKGNLTIVSANLGETKWIKKLILKDIPVLAVGVE